MEPAYTALHLALTFLLGLALAGALAAGRGAAWARRERALVRELERARAQLEAERAKNAWIEGAKGELADAFVALSHRNLEQSARSLAERSAELLGRLEDQLNGRLGTHKAELAGLVGPLREHLARLEAQVRALEEKREGAYGRLAEQLRALAEQQRTLQQATTTLGQALRSSSARGQWGELQLRRVVELAGMKAHVDFDVQVHTSAGRPDLVVRLPGGALLPVDAKAPLAAYLAALEAESDAERAARLAEHARALRARVKELAAKAYWNAFDPGPDLVVVFVPSEAALAAAFEADGRLLDDAIAQKVLPAGPVTLVALLKAVAYGWQQQALSENARRIADSGRVLIERLDTLTGALAEVGRGLEKSVNAYNRAVGSFQSRLAPALRRFRDHLGEDEGSEPSPLDLALRPPPNHEEPEA